MCESRTFPASETEKFFKANFSIWMLIFMFHVNFHLENAARKKMKNAFFKVVKWEIMCM
jgi:hypothetical protein